MRGIKRRLQVLEQRRSQTARVLYVQVRRGETKLDAFLRTCREKHLDPREVKHVLVLPVPLSLEEWVSVYGNPG